ncbi:MAG: DNA polymerase III subunit delta [Coriobacteriia bacterium]|nr:DNA polymerase III subunit delta [Coriobacteriia bacterium]
MENGTNQTQQKPLLPVYAILGEQSYLRDQAVDRLKKRLSQVGDIEFNYDQFDAATAEVEMILSAANTLPFASDYRLIIVNNIQQARKELLDGLGEYARSPSETTVLAIVGEKLVKSTKLYKAIKKAGGLVERSNPKKSELPAIIRSLFVAQGKNAPMGLCTAIVESVGDDIEGLNTAVTKIATYMGERTQVTPEDVDAMVEISAEIKVWELTNALQRRRPTEALATLERLLKQDSSLHMIHPAVVRAVRELIIARSLIDAGDESLDQIAATLGTPNWLAKRVREGAYQYSAEELCAGLERLAGLEYIMKTSNEGEPAYRRWILEFTTARS